MKVKVRIACAIDHKGGWSACGYSGGDDDTLMGSCIDTLEPGERRYWIEAEIERPDESAETVQGSPSAALQPQGDK